MRRYECKCLDNQVICSYWVEMAAEAGMGV